MQYENGIWVFGYGSLIWNPGFTYERKQQAKLSGFRRAFCLWSIHYRGTEDSPGLVLGLDPRAGESCEGVAYFIGPNDAEMAHAYLRERELVSYAYLEQEQPLALADGTQVSALCYIIDPAHSQYAGGLSLQEQAEIIARACGSVGPNIDYLHNTACHLAELGIADAEIERLSALVAKA